MHETNNEQNTNWQMEEQNSWQQTYPNPYCNEQKYYGQNAGYNNGQYYGQNAGYNNEQYYGQYYGRQPYDNPQYAYGQPPMKEPVTNIFYYILMALTAASAIIGIIAATNLVGILFSAATFDSITGQDLASLYSSMMYYFYNAPGYSAYSMLSSLLGFAIFAVSIIDIIQVHKKRYPILGLVLFTILFKPGYFIWRAYVLKQKKLIPILFTVSYALLYVGYFFWCIFYIVRFV